MTGGTVEPSCLHWLPMPMPARFTASRELLAAFYVCVRCPGARRALELLMQKKKKHKIVTPYLVRGSSS